MNIEDVANKRLEICKQCPLYRESPRYGPTCDNTKFISLDGKDWSYFEKKGYKRGCGCTLKHKTKQLKAHCIINLW